jgi:membrane-associated phospholipid phosphatase
LLNPRSDIGQGIARGCGLAVVFGQAIAGSFHYGIEHWAKLTRKDVYGEEASKIRGVPSWLTGVIETAVFAPAFVLFPTDAATGAFAWLALKMAVNWQQDMPTDQGLKLRRRAFLALLSGFLSLSVAAVVGWSVRGYLGCPLGGGS